MKKNLFWMSCCLSLLWSLPASAETTFTYTVKKGGETCSQIADDVYGDSGRVDLLHKYNDLTDKCWLGTKKARRLSAGTKLKLPEPPPAGRLSNKAGKVNSKSPQAQWSPAELGSELFRLWRVNTLEESRAEVTFRDRSRLEMRENTLILIYGSTRDKARSTPSRASLESGALRSKLDELAGGGVVVETPSSVAEVKSKSTLLTVEEGSGVTRVANHGAGVVGVISSKKTKRKKKSVTVKTGMGTKIEKGKEPEKPRPLPPTPSWKESPELFITVGEKPTTIFAEWDQVPAADSYYIEVAKDAESADVIQSVVVPKKINRLQVENLPPGDYFASVAAIDADQFESIPTGPRRIRVREIKTQGKLINSDPVQVAIGTAFISPNDIKCGYEDEETGRRTTIKVVGGQTLKCVDANDQPVGDFTVEGIPPNVTVESDAMDEETLNITDASIVTVKFDTQIPSNFTAESDVLDVGPPVRIDEQTLQFSVRPTSKTASSSSLSFKTGDTELSSVPVTVGESVAEVMWRFGAGLSYTIVEADDRFDQSVGDWTMVELFAGIVPNRRVSLELGLGLGSYDLDDGAIGALDYRVTGRFNVLTGGFEPFVSGTLGAQTNFDQEQTIAIVRAGLGFNIRFNEMSGLRFDGDVGIAEGRPTGISVLPRGQLGFFWEF